MPCVKVQAFSALLFTSINTGLMLKNQCNKNSILAKATARSNDNAGNETVGKMLSLVHCQSTVLYPLEFGTVEHVFIRVENESERIFPFANRSSETFSNW